MIARASLIRSLEAVAPALATNDHIPGLTHVWFTGDYIAASNEAIGLATPRTTTFTGSVPGNLLLDLLKIQKHAAVAELRAEGDSRALVKLGRARAKLPMYPLAELPFALPTMPNENLIKGVGGKFFAGIEHCLQTVETNATVKDKLGVTFIPDESELRLFSTTGFLLTRAVLPLPGRNRFKQRVILSREFCEAMLRLAKRATVTRLAIFKDHAVFSADDTILFGKLIKTDAPLNFEKMVSSLTENLMMVPIPSRMKAVLQRATRISEIVSNEASTRVSISGEMATFRAASQQRGEVTETMALPGHPDIELNVTASDVLKGFGWFDRTCFANRAVILGKGDVLRLISAHGVKKAETGDKTKKTKAKAKPQKKEK